MPRKASRSKWKEPREGVQKKSFNDEERVLGAEGGRSGTVRWKGAVREEKGREGRRGTGNEREEGEEGRRKGQVELRRSLLRR